MNDFSSIRTLTGKSRLAGVAGWPVSHSRSPRLHGYWLAQYGIDGSYMPLPVAPENFATSIRSLRDLGFAGLNVTIPHKEAALRICDVVSDRARRIGAVNTLIFGEDGRIHGDNTDGFGFIENLRQNAPDDDGNDNFARGPAVVLGAGGAARAILVALMDAGCPEIRLTNRTRARAEELARELDAGISDGIGNVANRTRITVLDWPLKSGDLADASLLVNTTSLGMTGQAELMIDLAGLPRDALVTDIVYAPLITPLLEQARLRGNPVVDGLGMLLHQARPGFHAWFGTDPVVTPDLREFVIS